MFRLLLVFFYFIYPCVQVSGINVIIFLEYMPDGTVTRKNSHFKSLDK